MVLALFFFASSGASHLLSNDNGAGQWHWALGVFAPPLLLLAGSVILIRRIPIILSTTGPRVWLPLTLAIALGAAGGLGIGGTSPADLAPGLAPVAQYLFAFVWVGIAAPAIEEVFFRGTLQTLLRRQVGPLAGIVLAALLFAAGHLSLGAVWLYFGIGLGFGAIAYLSRSVWPAVAAHVAWNTSTMLVGAYPVAAAWAPRALAIGAILALAVWVCLGKWGRKP